MFKSTLGLGGVVLALMIGSVKAMDDPLPQTITAKRKRTKEVSSPQKKKKRRIEYILTGESYPKFFYCVRKGLDLKPINSFIFPDPDLRVSRFDDNGRLLPTLSFNELAVYGQFASLRKMDIDVGIFSKIGKQEIDKEKVVQFFSPHPNLNKLTLRCVASDQPESLNARTLFEGLNEAYLVKLKTLKVHFTGEPNFNSLALLDSLPRPGSTRPESPLPALKYLEVTCNHENTQCTKFDALVIAKYLPKLERISLHDLAHSEVFDLEYPPTK